jgi:glycosyltransferase involved in cell wall biosynthesis
MLCVTDSGFTGAPVYVNQLEKILSEKYHTKVIVARNGALLKGEELHFDKERIFRLSDLGAIIRSVRIIKLSKPEFIWLNSFKMSLIIRIGLLFSGRYKSRIIYTVHGLSFRPGKSLRNGLIKWCEWIFVRFVDHFVFLTDYDCSIFRSKVSENIKYSIIPNFSRIDSGDLLPLKSDGCRNYVMIARNETQKDYYTLLNAFALFSKGKEVSLHCVGRGTERLDMIIRELGLQSKVFLHGESDKVIEFLENADVFVLSTHYEGMPLVILEAMSMGLPILATDVCGIGEFVANSFGLLIKPNSEEDWEGALHNMYELNGNDFNEMRLNAFEQYQKNFSIKQFNERVIQLIKEISNNYYE